MGKLRKACANCIKYKLACEAKRPCSRCVLHQCSCIDVERKPRAARKPKRPRVDETDASCSPLCLPAALPCGSLSPPSSVLSPSSKPSAMPYIPELVLNDNEPLFSSNLDTNFMMQSTEASLLPFNDLGFLSNSSTTNNNSYLSSVLMLDHDQASLGAPLLPKVESCLNDDTARKDYASNQPDLSFMNNPFLQSPAKAPAAPNKSGAPQPVVVINKAEWTVMDCNVEFAHFLGYNSIAELNTSLDLLNHAITPESLGLSQQFIQSPLHSHFDRVAMLKNKNGSERSVTLRVEIMEKLVTFTVKEVFEMRPMCFYTKWLKAVAPNAITPCDRVRCQCRLFDFMSTVQSQMFQPLPLQPAQQQQQLQLQQQQQQLQQQQQQLQQQLQLQQQQIQQQQQQQQLQQQQLQQQQLQQQLQQHTLML